MPLKIYAFNSKYAVLTIKQTQNGGFSEPVTY